ncbi:MAG: MFS transporter [Hyphomicrobiales bacterium]|nr:MFS transporter [Hyphomicrobiales bacterium]
MNRQRPYARLAARFGITPGATAAIATMVSVGIGISLLPPLISLTLSARGVSERMIGLIVAAAALSTLVSTPLAAPIAARLGTATTIAGCTFFAAAIIPFVWATTSLALLFALVFAYGFAITLCFVLSEYWINAVTPQQRRGFIMGLYATMLSIGFALGPAIIAVLGYTTIRPFIVGSVLFALAGIPTVVARNLSPDFSSETRHRFLPFIFAVPAATFGVFVFAMGETSGFTFLPLWGQNLAYTPFVVPLLASAMTLGNALFQIPLGLLADRFDKRIILLICGTIGFAGMVAAWTVTASPVALMAVLFVWGGFTGGLYTVGLAHLASRFSGSDLASATAAYIFCYALGMLIGPLIVGDSLARWPLAGFPLVLGIVFAAYALVTAWRIAVSRMSPS